jgi:Na+/H+ antiporter
MHEFELIVFLVVAAVALVWLAERLSVPYPMLLVVGGVAIAATPWLPTVDLASEVVLIIFLPPILFQAAQTTSVREFRENFGAISRLALGLVVVTAIAVAAVIHWLVPDLGWPAAFVLGAIVSPPDAVAATAIFQRLGAPSRIVAILEGESLINDASALVLYSFAVVAAVSGTFSPADALIEFPLLVAIGLGAGFAAGHLLGPLAMKMGDPSLSLVVLLVAPVATYVVTEWLGGSGVLGVVTAGLVYGFRAPRTLSSSLRIRSLAIWDLVTIVINGLVFLLIGLEIGDLVEEEGRDDLASSFGYALAVVATMVLVRFAYVFASAALGRRRSKRSREASDQRETFVIAWSGLRGVVSLATALALPLLTDAGMEFDHRQEIILITAFVVVLTLFGLGLPLPLILRRLDFAEEDTRDEERLAIGVIGQAMYAQYVAEIDRRPEISPLLQPMLDHLVSRLNRTPGSAELSMLEADADERAAMQQRVIDAARDALLELRDAGQISDEVRRQMERRLDLQELQLIA